MELPQRQKDDRFLPAGRYRELEETIQSHRNLADVRSLVVSAFDRRTQMFPFVHFDWYTVPCGPRSIAGSLYAAGMVRTRFVYQLWNPNLRLREVRLDGRPIDLLLISAMQVHAAPAYQLVKDAWRMGAPRPLILAGGPKACYEPFDFFGLGDNGDVGVDAVVTGEESVLMELLATLADFGAGPETMRAAFDRARQADALRHIPGLVYAADGRFDGKNLMNTGIQRLLADLDELPLPTAGFRTLEPPHRRRALAREPISFGLIGRRRIVTTLLITRGCKFHCHYCPIPVYNQRTYRRKSPARVVEEILDGIHHYNARYFFGADDNFFNDHRYSRELLETIAGTQMNGKPLGHFIRFGSESTVIDAYKCRDLFPIARPNRAGLAGLWMGVEDLAGSLIDKGQAPAMTKELFAVLRANKISPMVMMMHHDDQPLHSPGKLTGLIDQIRFLRDAGAVSLQCTVASPLYGTRWMNEVIAKGLLFESVGGHQIGDRDFEGNHVIATAHPRPLQMQINYLRAYASFYNPWNLLQAFRVRKKYLRRRHIFYQLWGMAVLVRTTWMLRGYLWQLWTGPIRRRRQWPDKFRRPGSPYTGLIETGQVAPGLETLDAPRQPISVSP